MEIELSDLTTVPYFDGRHIRLGDSWVEPCKHAALEHVLLFKQGGWLLHVRERIASQKHETIAHAHMSGAFLSVEEFRDVEAWLLNWPSAYCLLQVRTSQGIPGPRAVRLQASSHGIVPVYFSRSADRIFASWDFAEIVARTSCPSLDFQVAANALAMKAIYSARTIFQDIAQLTERAAVTFTDAETKFDYPPHAPQTRPRDLLSNVDAAGMLEKLVCATLLKRYPEAAVTCAELSGGLDSASVALFAARCLGAPVSTIGIKLIGDCASAQMERRTRLVTALDSDDKVIDIAEAMPDLAGPFDEGADGYVLSELYFRAFDQLWASAEALGKQYILKGVGGDELFPLYAQEREPAAAPPSAASLLTERAESAVRSGFLFAAPNTLVPATCLLAMAGHAPYLLRRGLWPLYPLCDPAVARFCHQLPYELRRERQILRNVVAGITGMDYFAPGYRKETFDAAMHCALLAQHDALKHYFAESALADLGLVRHDRLIAALDGIRADSEPSETTALIFAIYMERFFRRGF